MNDFTHSVAAALALIGSLDRELLGIVFLSLRVSLSASLIALAIGAPLGVLLAITRFRGRQVLIVLANALLGLPPVVVGLALYLVLSRSGPLGELRLLFTPLMQPFKNQQLSESSFHADETFWRVFEQMADKVGYRLVSVELPVALGLLLHPGPESFGESAVSAF